MSKEGTLSAAIVYGYDSYILFIVSTASSLYILFFLTGAATGFLQWGFRRCEDICWVKTNKSTATPGLRHDSHTLFQHSKVNLNLFFVVVHPQVAALFHHLRYLF